MGEMYDFMDRCYSMEAEGLNKLPREFKNSVVEKYIRIGEDLDIDTDHAELLTQDEKILVCDAYYTQILYQLRDFEKLLIRIYRMPFLRIFCDWGCRYMKELYQKVDILDALVNNPSSVDRQSALELADYMDNLAKTERSIKISIAAGIVVYLNIAIIALCIFSTWL